ncbi:MAG: PAS domain S-box protein, partial [Pyrinomonadaceae bacterium]|nr:PAS domain S-box protein [Pyrinomonadaceae bacterium]
MEIQLREAPRNEPPVEPGFGPEVLRDAVPPPPPQGQPGLSRVEVHVAAPLTLGDSIFNSIRDAILVINADATIDRVNPATLEQTGYTEDELIGQPISILSKNPRFFARIFEKSLQRDSLARRIETDCVRKDGSRFAVSLSTAKIFDPQTGTHRIVCVARDITERKRLEAESRAIARVMHGVTTTANLGELLSLVRNAIKRIVYAENFFVALFDAETESLTMQFWVDKYDPMPPPIKLGRSLSAYVFRHGESMLVTDEQAKRLIEQGEIESVGTDSPIWLGVPLTTPDGVIGVLVVQDYENSDTYDERDLELLTSVADQIALAIQRKKAEEEIRRTNERFELVTRATSDALWDWDFNSNTLWWNEGFQKLFGYRPHEVGDTLDHWTERLHPDDRERVSHSIKRAIDSGSTHWTEEYRYRRRDGSFAFV